VEQLSSYSDAQALPITSIANALRHPKPASAGLAQSYSRGAEGDSAFFRFVVVYGGRIFRAAKIVVDNHADNPGVHAGRFREKIGAFIERNVHFAKARINGRRAGD
jgi:hypothetical protein